MKSKKDKDLIDIFDFKLTKKNYNEETNELKFSCTTVTQNGRKFYTATIPSDVLASTCYVTSRYDDKVEGFQRRLDKSKAQEIANYIDHNKGTIPTSVILSAQKGTEFWIDRNKTLVFKAHNQGFLVLDGQHRVYGYYLAKTSVDVPVVIYNDLTKAEEAKLFIDINNKQTKVNPALLLDIKRLADEETDDENYLGQVFDLFHSEMESSLLGYLDKMGESNKKINRMNFNRALKPLLGNFIKPEEKDSEEVYELFNAYFEALFKIDQLNVKAMFLKSNYLYGFCTSLPEVVKEVRYKFGTEFSMTNFLAILEPTLSGLKSSQLKKCSNSGVKVKELIIERVRSTSDDW